MTNANAQQIAATIQRQIGERAFTMIGARMFSYDNDGTLRFRIGRNSRGVNFCKISLDRGTDTYDMEFGRIHGGTGYDVKVSYSDQYFDQLRDRIEDATGMVTSL